MNTYEIYWSDLTPEAQEKLEDLNHENVELTPIAIINIADDDIN
jgi:hypothetical protein